MRSIQFGSTNLIRPRVNFAHPIIKKPLLLEVNGNPISILNGRLGNRNASASESLLATRHGRAASFTGNTLAAHTYSLPFIAALTEITFAGVFVWRSGAANNFPQLCGTSSANSGFRIGASLAAGNDIALVKGGVIALNGVAVTSGVRYAFFCSHKQSTGEYYILLKDLASLATTSVTQTETSASSAGDGVFSVGNSRLDFSGAWNGEVSLCYMANTFFPTTTGHAFLKNPWQILLPMPRRIMLDNVVAAASTLRYSRTLTGVGY